MRKVKSMNFCSANNFFFLSLLPFPNDTDLKNKLEKFMTEETNKLFDENSQKALQRLKNGDINIDDVVTKWHNAFSEVRLFNPQTGC